MNNKNKTPVMVVYAIDLNNTNNNVMNLPWIYGVYTDQSKGLEVQNKMQNSKEYSHLYWDNKIVLLDKED